MAGTFAFGGTNLKKGASGDTVKRIQEALNNHGYGLGVDGVWGDKTDAAIRDYQTKNGLSVDGIYGVNTHNSIFGIAGTNDPSKPKAPDSYSNIDLGKYDSGYQKSDDVLNAEQKKTDAENAVNNYGDFSYGKQSDFDAIMNKILNREQFSYDLNGDALYQQYKDKYIQQGKMAMQDTMGQAAAMTGGYGSSYASTAGNQAYQASLQNLNDVIPELYQMALDKYNQEGQDLYNQYGMLSDDRNMQYGMWGDKRNQLVADRDYYGNEANNAYAKGYGEWSDQRTFDQNQYWKENEFGYGQYRDSVTDWENERSFQEAKRQFDEQMALSEKSASSGGSGGSGGGSGSGSGTGNDNTGNSGVSDSVRGKLDKLDSNTEIAEYLDGLEAAGVISGSQADALYAEYADNNEKFVKDKDGKTTNQYSYKDMVGGSKGWTVIDDGGGNLFGIDENAKVKAPNGETITLKNLKAKLVSEGMTKNQARDAIKKLQQNLGISSNWFFGL